jgi:hypothetical protein
MKALFGWCGGVVVAVAFTALAVAATIEDAQRIVDRAEPLRCEIHALELRLKSAAVGSDESVKMTDEVGKLKAALKLHYMATMMEYIEVMKTLPFEERKKVYAYSEGVAERCAAKTRSE